MPDLEKRKLIPMSLDGDSGGQVWIEAVDLPRRVGQGGHVPAASLADMVANFGSAMGQIEALFTIAQAKFDAMVRKPDEMTLELSATVSTKGDLVILSGTAGATLKVGMKWTQPKP